MSTTTTLLAAAAPAVVDGIQGLFETTTERYLATLALALLFAFTVWVIYLGGAPLKRRFGDELVDVARTLTIMAVALVSAAVFVVIWQAEGPVWDAVVEFSRTFIVDTETAVKLFVAFLALLGTYTITRITKRIVRYWSESGRISPHQRELAHHALQLGLFFLTVVFIFILFEQNPRDLFLGAGVLGVVVGFGARKTLADVLAGFVILFGRPFEAGDWIAIGDREGIVTEITIFNTQIRTFNEEHVLVPNDRVTQDEVINYSKTDRLRLTTEVGVDYDEAVDEAAAVAKAAIEDCSSVADAPGPDVVLDSFADSAVVLQLRYWIDRPTIQRKLSAQNEVIDAVKRAFEAEGIKIPFPQRELTGREETDGLRLSSEREPSARDGVEPAVRRVRERPTAVEEPVEDRYRNDGTSSGPGGDAELDGDRDADDESTVDESAVDESAVDESAVDENGGNESAGPVSDGDGSDHDSDGEAVDGSDTDGTDTGGDGPPSEPEGDDATDGERR